MIRPLHDINDEFFAEAAETPPLPGDAQSPDENEDVAELVSSFAFPAEAKAKTGRKPPRYIIPIVTAIVAIVLIVAAAVFALRDSPPAQGASSNDTSGTEDAGNAKSEEEGDAASGPGEGEYNSALDNLENELNDMRDSGEGDTESSDAERADATSANDASTGGSAALYEYLIAREYVEKAASAAARDALLSPETRRELIERIDARLSDGAGKNAVTLPADEEINSDTAFTSLTEKANALIDAVNAGRENGSRLPEVIDLRTKAHAIYPLRVLKKLLAIDYEDFGLYCASSGRPAEESFDAFLNSVKYRTAYLRELRRGSGAYGAEIRHIGRVYAEIAEIGGMDAERRRHAELIAACLYEMAARPSSGG
jgi:hypothetical protein